jgi:hypothetical protein
MTCWSLATREKGSVRGFGCPDEVRVGSGRIRGAGSRCDQSGDMWGNRDDWALRLNNRWLQSQTSDIVR